MKIPVNKSKIIFFSVGVLILLFLFKSFGIEKMITHFQIMGWKFLIICVLILLIHIALTYSWKIFINTPVKISQFYKLVLARIAGDTTASINTLGAFAGEPLKAMYIKDIVPFKTGLASVVLDRTIHTVANFLLILTGVICGIFILDINIIIQIIFLVFILLLLFIMTLVIKKQSDGFIEYIIKFIPERFRKFMDEQKWQKVKELDDEIAFVLSSKDNQKKFYTSLTIQYISILLAGMLEIYLIIIFIGADISLLNAGFVYIFSLFLTGFVFFMPANIGTSEGSFSIALQFLGYDPALGLSLGIIRRLRSFVWSAIGIAILFYAGLIKKEKE